MVAKVVAQVAAKSGAKRVGARAGAGAARRAVAGVKRAKSAFVARAAVARAVAVATKAKQKEVVAVATKAKQARRKSVRVGAARRAVAIRRVSAGATPKRANVAAKPTARATAFAKIVSARRAKPDERRKSRAFAFGIQNVDCRMRSECGM